MASTAESTVAYAVMMTTVMPQAMIPDVAVRLGGVFAEYLRSVGRGFTLSSAVRIDQAHAV